MSNERQSGPRRRPFRVLVRDFVTFVGGWYLMIYQAQFADRFEWVIFLGGMVAAGVPGAAQAWPAVVTRLTGQPPSSPAPEASSPESSSPSSTG